MLKHKEGQEKKIRLGGFFCGSWQNHKQKKLTEKNRKINRNLSVFKTLIILRCFLPFKMFTFSHQLDTFSINITKQSLWINMSHYWLTSVFASCLLSSSGSLQAKLAGAGRRADEGGGGVRWQQRGSDGRGRWRHPLWGPSAVVLYHCLKKMNKMCITGTLCVGKNMSVNLVFSGWGVRRARGRH